RAAALCRVDAAGPAPAAASAGGIWTVKNAAGKRVGTVHQNPATSGTVRNLRGVRRDYVQRINRAEWIAGMGLPDDTGLRKLIVSLGAGHTSAPYGERARTHPVGGPASSSRVLTRQARQPLHPRAFPCAPVQKGSLPDDAVLHL